MLMPILAIGAETVLVAIAVGAIVFIGVITLLVKCYQKVAQGTALVRNGGGGSKVSFTGMFVIPIIHRAERMDISIKRIEITRTAEDGLICRDNMRADTRVAFFVKVNKTPQDVLRVAQTVGCRRASEEDSLRELFDAKFSDALKTVGKKFDFVELYEERARFRDEIVNAIGDDLNGYVLDDCAIDHLEQTSLDKLDPTNILDAEGIKKITKLTAEQQILANQINRDREKTIVKQDVEAREVVLELERQQVEAEERQLREIASTRARERAEAAKVEAEELLKSERARIATQEEVEIAEENRLRQVLVAAKAKERTNAVETERVEKDRLLEVTERDRIVTLAEIEKEKAVEQEKKIIQDVIRERVIVQRAVVEEEERIKDTREFAGAERQKQVAITGAEEIAQHQLIQKVKAAEADKGAAERHAEKRIVEAEAELVAAAKEADAKKLLAEATAAEEAAIGLAEAEVLEAKAAALEKQGRVEAEVLFLKAEAEAKGIEDKAAAMAKLSDASREHEEYRLRLALRKDVELARIEADREIAQYKAGVVSKALESARIDIVGGESTFFDRIVNSVGQGKGVDRMVEASTVLTDVKNTFFNGDPGQLAQGIQGFVEKFGLSTEDIKNLTISALLGKMIGQTDDVGNKSRLESLLGLAESSGFGGRFLSSLSGSTGSTGSTGSIGSR